MPLRNKKIKYASTERISENSREVQLLVNVVEPDPEYQAFFISDEAALLDVCGVDPSIMQARLDAYFNVRLAPEVLRMPLPDLVEHLKREFPPWPEEWPPNPS